MLRYHIQTIEVGATAVGEIDFIGIPQIYDDIYVVLSGRNNGTSGNGTNITFNDNTSGYTNITLQGNGASASSYGTYNRMVGNSNYASETANTFGIVSCTIFNYASNSINKTYSSDSIAENASTTAYSAITAGLWSNTSPITSISLSPMSGSWVQYSSASLYGIKRGSDGKTEVASGGVISYSGGYTIHTFDASGTFVANRNMDVEYLVIAGGGSGGSSNSGGLTFGTGGGGAGGYRSSVIGEPSGGGASAEPTIRVNSGNSYYILVGAGGPGTGNARTSGSNSVFASITSIGGGHGDGTDSGGASGGSGGGGLAYYSSGFSNQTSGGSGTIGQGFAGGVGVFSVVAGGGGGAGEAGNTDGSGSGGDGIASSITGSLITRGGGGGGAGSGAAQLAGLGGGGAGGANGADNAGSNGVANTGGGGGGAFIQAGGTVNGGNGGSGVVIIRYLTP